MSVNIGMNTIGESRATTLPASMGLLDSVQVTPRLPQVFLAVTSQATSEKQRPKMGDNAA